jgi:hypothetical protein
MKRILFVALMVVAGVAQADCSYEEERVKRAEADVLRVDPRYKPAFEGALLVLKNDLVYCMWVQKYNTKGVDKRLNRCYTTQTLRRAAYGLHGFQTQSGIRSTSRT